MCFKRLYVTCLIFSLLLFVIHLAECQEYCQANHWPDGPHPHPQHCDRYILCSNNHTTVEQCPSGALYNEAVHACSTSPDIQKCNDATSITPTVSPDEDYCRQNNWAQGRHPHPKTCDRYVECFNFHTSILPCSSGLLYDAGRESCIDNHTASRCNDANSTIIYITGNPQCYNTSRGDILFLLDSSSSIGYLNFEKQLTFAVSVTELFPLDPGRVQFSLVVFSAIADSRFRFDTYHTKDELSRAIMQPSYVGSSTNTAAALELARTLSFTPSNGARQNVAHVALVVTDGLSNNYEETRLAAERLKASNVTVMAIGIGNFSQHELQLMASNPSDVKQVENHDLLETLKQDVFVRICNMDNPDCDKADVIFLLDSSSSIGYENYEKQLRFAANLTQNFKLGDRDFKFAAISFGSKAQILFHLNTYFDPTSIYQAIMSSTYQSSSTNTAEALRFVYDSQMFEPINGGRRDALKMIIVMTDGQSDDPARTSERARYIKDRGIEIITIGVGYSLNVQELITLSSDLSKVFCAESYDVISSLHNEVFSKTCQPSTVTSGSFTTSQPSTVYYPHGDIMNICREQNWANGPHAHPFDCTKFIECNWLNTYVMNCPPTLVWDPLKNSCMHIRDAVSCFDYNDYKPVIGRRQTVSTEVCKHMTASGLTTSGESQYDLTNICRTYNLHDGVYPDPSNCNSFLECLHGVTRILPCPVGYAFNSVSRICDFAHMVNCNDNHNYVFVHFV